LHVTVASNNNNNKKKILPVFVEISIHCSMIMEVFLGILKYGMDCHRKNGLGKNGPAGPILDEKVVQLDHFW